MINQIDRSVRRCNTGIYRVDIRVVHSNDLITAAATADIDLIGIALALSEYNETEYAHGHLKHTAQIVVVVNRQQFAVLVRIVDVELNTTEAVQAF